MIKLVIAVVWVFVIPGVILGVCAIAEWRDRRAARRDDFEMGVLLSFDGHHVPNRRSGVER